MRPVSFSQRTRWDTTASPLAEAIAEARAAGREPVNLAESNPTRCGFQFDPAEVLGGLSDPRAMQYEPDPLGLVSARQAVSAYYAEAGADVPVEHLLLTTSTSEAYSFLLRLLCNPGDEVLVAQPSYPLFDFLATLHDVTLRPYPLFRDFGWWIDFSALEEAIGPATRALLLVHPNNPTGHFTREREQLEELCARHGLALIVDEVFLDFPIEANAELARSFAQGPHPALTFAVNGLSKMAALPQAKVAWLAAFGPAAQVREAMARLEIVSDTFLSLNTPAQLALPGWLAGRAAVIRQLRERVSGNLRLWREHGFDLLPVEAGWSGVLRLPGWLDVQAETLVREAGVIVHPGSFYGFAGPGWVVVSLIVQPAACREGVRRLQAWVREHPPLG